MTFEEATLAVYQQALVDNLKIVTLGEETYSKVMQFLEGGKYVAVVVNGKVRLYATRKMN